MQTFFQTALFIFIIISVPVFIFLTARKIGQWVVGVVLLLFLVLYYAQAIYTFFDSHNYHNGLISWFMHVLFSYQLFVLGHWPHLNGLHLFGLQLFSMNVNASFTTTWWPLIILYTGGIIRLVVVRFVPSYRAREIAHEYWLYITSFLILLLILSNILDWNVLITIIVFIFSLLLIATGVHRILGDIIILLINIGYHIFMWIWIGMKYIAFIAVKIAKFLHRVFKNIRQLYDTYIRGPFEWINQKLVDLESDQKDRVEDKLNSE